MTGHAGRAHALLSASGAHRWMACTPSARLEEQFPDRGSEAADEGTLAHELAEAKLQNYFFPQSFGKKRLAEAVRALALNDLWQAEMQGYTDDYLDYIKSAALAFKAEPYVAVEKRVDFSRWVPDGFGTADCILIGGGTIHVIDFKYGKGVPVDAEENPQMKLYALGACDAYRMLYPIGKIKLSIVQPRLPDGISEWECGLDHLLAFGEYAKGRAALAIEGKGPYAPGEKQCRFCRARAQCRARSDYNVKLAFDIGQLPPLITAEEAGKRLLALEDVAKYQSDLQEWALAECLAGKAVPGWKAVEGRGSRGWTDMEQAFETLQLNHIPRALLYEERPLTLAQVEKAVGKKEFQQLVGNYVTKNPGKPALVKESDKRKAITNKITAAEAFQEGETV